MAKSIEKEIEACGGVGYITVERLLDPAQLEQTKNCDLFAQVTIEPGNSVGFHEHHGETETYYILSGQGEYDDNGTKLPVQKGDVTFTANGCGHALANTGSEPLVFMAMIVKI